MPIDTSGSKPNAPAARKTARKPAAQSYTSKAQARAEGINDWFKIGALFCIARGQYADAGACAEHGPRIAAGTAEFAESYEQAAKIVDYLCEAGPVASLMACVLPFAFQIAANHGRIDATKISSAAGIVPPETLEARVRLGIEQERARLAAEQKLAEQEMTRLQGEASASA